MLGPRALKALSMILRVLQVILSLFVVGVASFHTFQFATKRLRLTDDDAGQPPRALYAILVISCVAALFSFLALLTTCLGHKKFFIVAILFDLLLTAGFTAISVLLRGSASQTCRGINYSGAVSKSTTNLPSSLYSPSTQIPTNVRTSSSARLLCNLDKTTFSLAIALTVFFFLTLLLSTAALRAYRRNRAFGPSPANGYATRNAAHKSWTNPFQRASEETAYTSNTAMTGTTAGGYDAPGFRGSRVEEAPAAAAAAAEYRAPVVGHGARAEENGVFDPSLPHAHAKEVGYRQDGYGNQNF